MRKGGAALSVVLLDACRVNAPPFGAQTRAALGAPRGMCVTATASDAALSSSGTVIAWACSDGEVAYDGSGGVRNGLFTKHLLRHMAAGNTLDVLLSRVKEGVAAESSNRQVPCTAVDTAGDAVLAPNVSVRLRPQASWAGSEQRAGGAHMPLPLLIALVGGAAFAGGVLITHSATAPRLAHGERAAVAKAAAQAAAERAAADKAAEEAAAAERAAAEQRAAAERAAAARAVAEQAASEAQAAQKAAKERAAAKAKADAERAAAQKAAAEKAAAEKAAAERAATTEKAAKVKVAADARAAFERAASQKAAAVKAAKEKAANEKAAAEAQAAAERAATEKAAKEKAAAERAAAETAAKAKAKAAADAVETAAAERAAAQRAAAAKQASAERAAQAAAASARKAADPRPTSEGGRSAQALAVPALVLVRRAPLTLGCLQATCSLPLLTGLDDRVVASCCTGGYTGEQDLARIPTSYLARIPTSLRIIRSMPYFHLPILKRLVLRPPPRRFASSARGYAKRLRLRNLCHEAMHCRRRRRSTLSAPARTAWKPGRCLPRRLRRLLPP